ncbi:MAG: hypothetical protein JKY54_01920, partial [Flavobacteriales bacterium]|nr:hypothetical protein [Flavobacteriales bacterium]
GMMGPKSRQAARDAMASRRVQTTNQLFHHSGIHSVIWHWTAGAMGMIDLERHHYNAITDQDRNIYDGEFRPEAQATYAPGRAASHTLNANTHRASVSMDCMAGAKESPFDWGSNPMTWNHVHAMLDQTAQWVEAFDIEVSEWTTLSHAEVQSTLGIKQRNKWDINILPDMDKPGSAHEVGNRLRKMLKYRLK